MYSLNEEINCKNRIKDWLPFEVRETNPTLEISFLGPSVRDYQGNHSSYCFTLFFLFFFLIIKLINYLFILQYYYIWFLLVCSSAFSFSVCQRERGEGERESERARESKKLRILMDASIYALFSLKDNIISQKQAHVSILFFNLANVFVNLICEKAQKKNDFTYL